MDFLNTLDDNSILIIPNNIKDKVLDYIDQNNLLINIKIMSFNDLKKALYFNYDNQAIDYIMNKYNTSYNIAKDNINNIYYVIDYESNENKIKYLKNMYNELSTNNLLYIDNLFINLLKSKTKLYVYGFDYINKFNNHLLDKAKEHISVLILDKQNNKYDHIIYKATSLEEEVLFVCEEISKLISNNVPLNKIFISGIDNDYMFTIKRIFKKYNIPLFIKNENVLYDTAIAKYFFNNLDNNIENTLNKISIKYNIKDNTNNKVIYDKLISLIDKYYWSTNYTDIKDLMIEEAKTISLPSIHMNNEIITTNIIDNEFYDDEYVFLMNFNMNVFPKVFKDEDYINDLIKPDYLDKSSELNIINKDSIIKAINNIKNLTITYKLHSPFKEYLPSYLIRDYWNDNSTPINFEISNYSNKINELLYAKKLDNLIKYKINNNSLPILSNNYSIPYNKYDNSFTKLNINISNIKYSYSNMTNYFKCPFRFYLSNVLCIDEFTKTFNTFVGLLFHSVLENCLKDKTKDIDEAYNDFINQNDIKNTNDKYVLNYHDEFFIEKVRNEIHIIMDIVNEQYKYLDSNYHELFEIKTETTSEELGLDTKINAVIKGIADKCIIIDNDVIVIDYKTGTSDKIDRNTFEYGLHIQLPIYLYLLETLNPEYNVAGIYLQKILTGNNSKDIKKSQIEKRKDELKLDGLTTTDTSVISKFDNEYSNSQVFKKGRTGSRDLTTEDKEEIKTSIKNLITDCINNVYDANFEIRPININDGVEDGCKYCSFKDVCYIKKNQYKYINTKKDGDDNEYTN